MWPMPLWAGYDDEFSSKIADIGNVSASPFAGSPIAALFLKRFVTATPALAARRPVRVESEGASGPARGRRSAVRAERVPTHSRALRMIAVRPRHLLLLIGITFIWGVNLITSKIGVGGDPADPVHVPALRHRGRAARAVAAHASGADGHARRRGAPVRRAQFRAELRGAPARRRTFPPSPSSRSSACRSRRCCRCACSARWFAGGAGRASRSSFLGVVIMGFDPQIGDRWESLALRRSRPRSSARSGSST